MKILIGNDIKGADYATIEREPIDSVGLMERAAELIAQWVCNNVEQGTPLLFFAGKGNNGGDALAAARMLSSVGYGCTVVLPFTKESLSEDCRINLERIPGNVVVIDSLTELKIQEDAVVFDALLGTGTIGAVKEPLLSIIELINSLHNRVVSIDMPSGMSSEFGNDPAKIVAAETTLTIEQPKLAMMLPEAGDCCGKIEIITIDLDAEYIEEAPSPFYYLTEDSVRELLIPRRKFAHKGDYGHAMLICGSEGMMGAAVLATSGALRSGCGIVTTHIPANERFTLQASCPSALVSLDRGNCFSELPMEGLTKYDSIGIGSGMGSNDETKLTFLQLLKHCRDKKMVFDADALNIIARHPELTSLITPGSILTPHVGELKRLIGEWSDEKQKIELVQDLSANLNAVVVLKGAHTMICTPEGDCFFNSSGCNGMAKGGSGDILTGFIAGLLARGYEPSSAACLGVYLHGKAGEKAADYYGNESMNSSDIIDFLAEALSELQ